jgi:hypothetical protein
LKSAEGIVSSGADKGVAGCSSGIRRGQTQGQLQRLMRIKHRMEEISLSRRLKYVTDAGDMGYLSILIWKNVHKM